MTIEIERGRRRAASPSCAAPPPVNMLTAVPTTIIQPSHGWAALNLREVWRYHELLYILMWRDIKVRYKQSVLGVAWAVLRPFLTMVIFSVVFGWLVRVPTGDVPYPIFSYAGLLPWTFFAAALTQSSVSLVGNANLISKVYFPRLVMPLASVLACVVDFAVAFVLLLGLLLYYGVVPGPAALAAPLFALLAFMTALGCGLWLAALNVKYRDINHTVPFLVQTWLFVTPVVYPSSLIPEQWRLLYGLNPMVGVVEGFRWALVGTEMVAGDLIAASTVTILVLLIGGLFYFRRVEREFADVV